MSRGTGQSGPRTTGPAAGAGRVERERPAVRSGSCARGWRCPVVAAWQSSSSRRAVPAEGHHLSLTQPGRPAHSLPCVAKRPTVTTWTAADDLRRRQGGRRRGRRRCRGRSPARAGQRRHRQRVFAAAGEVGYRSNALPGPHRRRTHMLALVVTDITNPFYAEVIRGAHEAAGSRRLHDPARRHPGGRAARTRLDRARAGRRRRRRARQLADVGQRHPDDRQAEAARRAQPADPEVPCVITDNARGARRAVEHLAELGHDSLTYVAGPEASWADGMRWRALREAAYRARDPGPPGRAVQHPDGARAASSAPPRSSATSRRR